MQDTKDASEIPIFTYFGFFSLLFAIHLGLHFDIYKAHTISKSRYAVRFHSFWRPAWPYGHDV